jgi:3-oxoacyl-[acyl-carrier-protein] synthase III
MLEQAITRTRPEIASPLRAATRPRPRVASPVRPAARAALLSVATQLPSGRLTTAELAPRLGVTEDWIISRTGVRERPIAAPDERLSDFAARAGAIALQRAELEPGDLDLVLAATMTQDELSPNTAPLVAHQLGARHAGAIDLGAACTAFLSGIALGAAQIESGRARNVLLIGADFVSRITDWDDKRTAPLFGDAAAAAVLAPAAGEYGAVGPIVLGSDGSGAATIQISHDDRKLRMDGPEVYRHAVARMIESTLAAVDQAGLTLDQIDLFVYHQANGRILSAVGERLGLPEDRVVDCIGEHGNTSAATLPLALAHSYERGRLRAGDKVLLGAFGAGFTWGATVIEWGIG